MNKPREFEITLKSELIKPGHFQVSEEVLLLNRQDEMINFPAKFHAIEYSAYSELKEKLAVASESLTYERRERYKSDKKFLEKLAIANSTLEFYADRDNYCLYEDLSVDEWKYNWIAERPHPQKIDKVGTLATKALAKINEEE